jgi:ATP-dependent Clp protease, protease subunit
MSDAQSTEDLASCFNLGPSYPAVIFLQGPITIRSIENVLVLLWTMHLDLSFNQVVNLVITSPGGDMDAGWALIDTLTSIRLQVRTIALGTIASVGTMIFSCGDKRIMTPNSTAMIHHFSTREEGTYIDLVAGRTHHDLEYRKMVNFFVQHSRYKSQKEVLKHLLKPMDVWLSPKEMLAHGLCDEIL